MTSRLLRWDTIVRIILFVIAFFLLLFLITTLCPEELSINDKTPALEKIYNSGRIEDNHFSGEIPLFGVVGRKMSPISAHSSPPQSHQ